MKNKKDDKFSYALGITLTFELLNFRPKDCVSVYIHSKFTDAKSFEKLINLCKEKNIEVIYSDKIFNVLSNKENCYVIGKFKRFNESLEKNSDHIVLVNPSNAGNLGTIIRTCVGFGINNLVLITPCVDIFDPKCVRASMGSIFRLHFSFFSSFDEYERNYPQNTIYPFMLKAKNNLSAVTFNHPASLVFGNEATGLPDSFLNYDNTLIIKHTNNIDSLNLTIAASIACYELTKTNFK
ncbi:rNA methyltransferase TrmH family [Coprobacillus sp. CAG:698]|nr:rNA methyltransferase TrmH family [Coprobacillus sp. CAG:698]